MPPKRPVGGDSLFSKRISRARHALKLTAEQLGERVGVAKNTVYSWERGETIPHRGRRAVVAEVLQLDVEELESLITRDDHERPTSISSVGSALPVAAEIVTGGIFTLEISGIRVNVPVQTVPIYVRVAIGPIESEVTKEPRR